VTILRTYEVLTAISKIAEKFESRLEKIQIRQRNLLGDCIILAASVVYLGIFSLRERITIRNLMAETLSLVNIESSNYWLDDKEYSHCGLFKKLINEKDGEKAFLNLSHLFHESQIAEVLFCLQHAPSTAVLIDSTGYIQ
jgi:hypothetical protein